MESKKNVILGAGVCGLAAANVLTSDTVVLEKSDQPGGLVKADCIDGYWFDHVLHLLSFRDEDTERRIRHLLADVLEPCEPFAWVETMHGTVRYPFQMHLKDLDLDVVIRCITDLAKMTFEPDQAHPANFEELLLKTFGETMCETFLFPYNRKMWKRPLQELAPSGFSWTITPPDFQRVVAGALSDQSDFKTYNANGCYPRPPAKAKERGMGVLSSRLAENVTDLRLGAEVISVDLEKRSISYRMNENIESIHFSEGCASTIPLPTMLKLCKQAPADLLQECKKLTRNSVYSVALCFKGERPKNTGLWRYYADPSIVFNRLVYMHAFDPLTAPPDGWGLLAEITHPAELPALNISDLLERVIRDVRRVKGAPNDSTIINSRVHVVDPAYVVFTPENHSVVQDAKQFLTDHGISPLGRYGRWEYSSMAQVMRDGFEWADAQVLSSDNRSHST